VCISQGFSFNPGLYYHKSKTIEPVLNQFELFDNESITIFRFDYYLKKILIGLSVFKTEGWTGFNVNADIWRGFSSSRTNLLSINTSVGLNLFDHEKKLKIFPLISLGLINSSYGTSGKEVVNVLGNEFGSIYKGIIYVESYKRIIPIVGFGINLNWNIFDRFCILSTVNYTQGFNSYQDYLFEYSYDGIEQPSAEWFSDGTSFDVSVGVGILFNSNEKD
jgi:hypothetical protein